MPTDKKPVATTRESLRRINRVCDRVEGRSIGGNLGRRARHISGGAGSTAGKKTAIVQATDDIAAAVDSGTRTPEESTDFTPISGDTFMSIFNWSLVEITSGSYLVILEIDGEGVIVSAFC